MRISFALKSGIISRKRITKAYGSNSYFKRFIKLFVSGIKLAIVIPMTLLFILGEPANAEVVLALFTQNDIQVANYLDFYKYNEKDWIQTTQSDFESGSLLNLDSTFMPGSLVLESGGLPSDWWNISWLYRQRFDVANNATSPLANFQLLFEIDSGFSDFWSNVRSDGGDIRVVDENGTVWNHWFETWDYANQSVKIWGRLPTIAASSQLKAYVYYGNATAVSTATYDNTFTKDPDAGNPYNDANLMAEWHIDEGSGTRANNEITNNHANFTNNLNFQIEFGTANHTGIITTVGLSNTYRDPVVIASIQTYNNTNPLVVRINNAAGNSFSFSIQDQNGNLVTTTEQVGYVVVERGAYLMTDGTKVEAGKINTNNEHERLDSLSIDDWIEIEFKHEYGATPVVLTQVMDYKATPLAMVRTRTRDISQTGFEVILQNQEGFTSVLQNQEIGWIAVEDKAVTISGTQMEFGSTPNVVDHNFYNHSFATDLVGNPPIIIAQIATMNDDDPGYLRMNNRNRNSVNFRIQEDTYSDLETNHSTEIVNYFGFRRPRSFSWSQSIPWGITDGGHWGDRVAQLFATGSFVNLALSQAYMTVNNHANVNITGDITMEAWVKPENIAVPKMEVGQVTTDENWASVTLLNKYANPVVVALSSYVSNSDSPASVRIQNLTDGSFQIRLQAPPDNFAPCEGGNCTNPDLANETITYLVIEEGIWNLDGMLIQAGRHDTATVSHGNFGSGTNWAGDIVSFTQEFKQGPIVLHQVQTYNDGDWISSWVASPSSKNSPPTVTGMQISLQGAEVTTTHGEETVGWVAFEPNKAGKVGNVAFETIKTDTSVQGYGNGCFTYSFNNTYSGVPIVVGSVQTMLGPNGGWLQRCSLSSTQVGLQIDEDQANDAERNHVAEIAGMIIFANAARSQAPYLMQKGNAYGIEILGSYVWGVLNNGVAVGAQLNSGEWNHLIVTYNLSSLDIYVNGVLQDTKAYSSAISTNADIFIMGQNYFGALDEVKIYNKAFDAGEAVAHYQRRKYVSPYPSVISFGMQQDQNSAYVASGTYESVTFDTSDSRVWYGYLDWDGIVPTDTTLRFQIATNNDNATWNFVGPDGTAGTYYTVADSVIAPNHQEQRYFRVRAYFATSDNTQTPILHEIRLKYADTTLILPGDVFVLDGNVSKVRTHPLYRVETSSATLDNSLVNLNTSQAGFANAQAVSLKINETSDQIIVASEIVTQPQGANVLFDQSNPMFITIDEQMILQAISSNLEYNLFIYVNGRFSPVLMFSFDVEIDT